MKHELYLILYRIYKNNDFDKYFLYNCVRTDIIEKKSLSLTASLRDCVRIIKSNQMKGKHRVIASTKDFKFIISTKKLIMTRSD